MLQMQPLLARERVNKHLPFQGLAQSLFLIMADIAMSHLKTLVH
jgi:hypothetical protein